jgi:hypothetical protein
MWQCDNYNFEATQVYPKENNKKNVLSNIIKNFYEDIEKPIIIDRNKTWANPDNLDMIKKYINSNPKIIFTIRPIEERIVSMINILKDETLLKMKIDNFPYNKSISENDNIAEYLLMGNTYALEYFAYNSYIKKENSKNIHLVKYEDLLKTPTDVLNNIYSFLEIDNFSHDFYNIKKTKEELSYEVKTPKDLHKIKNSLKNNNLVLSDFLSDKMIKKCKDANLFYN